MAKKDKNREFDWKQTSLENFPKLDFSYYRETTGFLESEGFSFLGDFEDGSVTTSLLRTCHRVLTGDQGNIQAYVYHIHTSKIAKFLPGSSPFKFKLLDLETEFTDGYFIITTNNVLVNTGNPALEVNSDPQASIEQQLKNHRKRVETYLTENPAVQVWKADSIGATLDSQRRQFKMRNSREAQKEFKKTRKKKKPGISLPGRDSSVTLAEDICKRKRTILKVVTVFLIAMILGYVNMERDAKRYEKVKQLTIEQYKADYEKHQTGYKPIPPGNLFLFVLFLSCVLFGWYEIGVRVGDTVMNRTLCKGKDTQPASESAKAFSMPQVVKSGVIGKAVTVLLLSLLLTQLAASIDRRDLTEKKQLTYEEYVAGYEDYKKQQTSPPSSFSGNEILHFLVIGLLVLFYELGGKTAQAFTLLYYTKKIPIGTHMFLNFVLWAVFSFGGLIFLVTKVKGGGPQLFALVVYFTVISKLFKLLFDAIPVICPQCGGKAKRTSARHISYTCLDCKHEHRTSLTIGGR